MWIFSGSGFLGLERLNLSQGKLPSRSGMRMARFSLLILATLFLATGCINNPVSSSTNPTAAPTSSGPSATPTVTPAPGSPTATATPTPPSVGASGLTYSPNSLSIPAGTTVQLLPSLNGHTFDVDNGAGSCASSITVFPTPYVTYTFSTTGTFHVHCHQPGHSTCGAGVCSGCTGMVMTVVVY
jgi:plastocyanin